MVLQENSEIWEVIEFTKRLVADNPQIKDNIFELPVLYHGKLCDLYPDIDTQNPLA